MNTRFIKVIIQSGEKIKLPAFGGRKVSEARLREYVVDLTKIEGTGDFPCPNCGVRISPEDESETVYSILKTKIRRDRLEELIIQCNQCLCKIRLMGFLSLDSEEI